MAERTRLIFRGLVVKTRSAWGPRRRSLGMATDAQKIDLVLLQQALIRRTVRCVTSGATFDLRLMLVNEGALFFGVAFVTDLISRSVRPQLFRPKCPVGAVAIIALDESLIHAVMKGTHEFGTHARVACVTEVRRLSLHQVLAFLGVVRRVAINARDAVGQVRRAVIVSMLFGVLVAAKAASAGLLRRGVFKGIDFGFIAAAVDVLFPRAMASLAAMPLHAFVRVELRVHGGGEVGRSGEMGVEVLVAGLAGIGTHVKRRVGWPDIFLRLLCLRFSLFRGFAFVVT